MTAEAEIAAFLKKKFLEDITEKEPQELNATCGCKIRRYIHPESKAWITERDYCKTHESEVALSP